MKKSFRAGSGNEAAEQLAGLCVTVTEVICRPLDPRQEEQETEEAESLKPEEAGGCGSDAIPRSSRSEARRGLCRESGFAGRVLASAVILMVHLLLYIRVCRCSKWLHVPSYEPALQKVRERWPLCANLMHREQAVHAGVEAQQRDGQQRQANAARQHQKLRREQERLERGGTMPGGPASSHRPGRRLPGPRGAARAAGPVPRPGAGA